MRILLIGDSILDAMATRMSGALRSLNPTAVYVEAKVGSRTRWWYADSRLSAKVDEYRPDLVVVMLGTNDLGEEDNPSSYELLWDHVIQTAGMYGATVVVVGPFGAPGAAARWSIIRGVARLAVDGLELAEGIPRTPDGIHFTAAGSELLASRLAAALRAVLAGEPQPTVRRSKGLPLGVIAMGLGVGLVVLLGLEVV